MNPEFKRYNCSLPRREALAVVALTNGVWPCRDKTLEELARPLIEGMPAERPEQEILTLWDNSRVIAHATTFRRTIYYGTGQSLSVLALVGVCVEPAKRGYGLGARIVRKAFRRIESGEFPVCLFQTNVPDFYRRLGARTVDNPFVNRQADNPELSPWWDPYVMIYPAAFAWPSGTIDLDGPGY